MFNFYYAKTLHALSTSRHAKKSKRQWLRSYFSIWMKGQTLRKRETSYDFMRFNRLPMTVVTAVIRFFPRSHALRGNALPDAPRPHYRRICRASNNGLHVVPGGIPLVGAQLFKPILNRLFTLHHVAFGAEHFSNSSRHLISYTALSCFQ